MTGPVNVKTRLPFRARLARRCLQLALVMFVVGIVLALLAQWGERRANANATWRNPGDTVNSEGVAVDLAMLSLAGVSDDQVLVLAMALSELDTVHAVLAFSGDLGDGQRTNGWLWLAERYHRANQMERAADAYRLAGDGAILSVGMSDLLRTRTLLAVGLGLTRSHDQDGGRFYLRQSAIIGANTSQLTAYHRQALLQQLAPAVVQAGGGRDDWKDLSQAIQHGGSGVSEDKSNPSGASLNGTSPAPLGQAQAARREAAAAWLAVLTATGDDGHANTDVARTALVEALRIEEATVNQYVTSTHNTSAERLKAQETLIAWLSLKRRIAGGGVGASLMPEWAQDQETINETLNTAWREWSTLQPQVAAIDDNAGLPFGVPETETLSPEAARRAVMAAYWGLYPDAPVTELLLAAQARGDFSGLRLAVLEPGTPPRVGWSK